MKGVKRKGKYENVKAKDRGAGLLSLTGYKISNFCTPSKEGDMTLSFSKIDSKQIDWVMNNYCWCSAFPGGGRASWNCG